MGVTTASDKKIQEAKEKLEDAYKLLLEAANPDTGGIEQYPDHYVNGLLESLPEILRIKNKL